MNWSGLIFLSRLSNGSLRARDSTEGSSATKWFVKRIRRPSRGASVDHDIRNPEPSREVFALDPVEAWEVPLALVRKQGVLAFWNEVLLSVHADVLMGWNQARDVCQLIGA